MEKALYATFRVRPGHEAKMADLVRDLTQAVRAEPGNRRFIAYTLTDDPCAYHVDEIYADEAAFQAHLGSEHCKNFNLAIRDMVEDGGSKVVFLTVS